MNRHVTPKQLELTAGMSREELLLATAPHIDPGSPALKADRAKVDAIAKEEAARAVLGLGDRVAQSSAPVKPLLAQAGPPRREDDRFDWTEDNDCVILHEQPATAVYFGGGGHLVVRQTNGYEDDVTILVAPQNITAFLEATAKKARE